MGGLLPTWLFRTRTRTCFLGIFTSMLLMRHGICIYVPSFWSDFGFLHDDPRCALSIRLVRMVRVLVRGMSRLESPIETTITG